MNPQVKGRKPVSALPQQEPRCEPAGSVEPAGEMGDEALVARAVDGDREAFGQLYHRHAARVFGLSLRLTADREQAEILTQDAFVKAWTSLRSFGGQGSLAGWLGRMTVNLWRDRYRSRRRRERLHEEAAQEMDRGPHQSGAVVPLLTALDLEKAVQKLPAGARSVFVLHDVEGYKHHEIAAMLELTTGTVKSQLHRARRLLRLHLGEPRTDSQGA